MNGSLEANPFMETNQGFVFKVSYPENSGTYKISLRWIVDAQGKVSLDELLKLVVAFPEKSINILENYVALSYRDLEDDSIKIATSKELVLAMKEFSDGGVLRLVVDIKPREQYKSSDVSSVSSELKKGRVRRTSSFSAHSRTSQASSKDKRLVESYSVEDLKRLIQDSRNMIHESKHRPRYHGSTPPPPPPPPPPLPQQQSTFQESASVQNEPTPSDEKSLEDVNSFEEVQQLLREQIQNMDIIAQGINRRLDLLHEVMQEDRNVSKSVALKMVDVVQGLDQKFERIQTSMEALSSSENDRKKSMGDSMESVGKKIELFHETFAKQEKVAVPSFIGAAIQRIEAKFDKVHSVLENHETHVNSIAEKMIHIQKSVDSRFLDLQNMLEEPVIEDVSAAVKKEIMQTSVAVHKCTNVVTDKVKSSTEESTDSTDDIDYMTEDVSESTSQVQQPEDESFRARSHINLENPTLSKMTIDSGSIQQSGSRSTAAVASSQASVGTVETPTKSSIHRQLDRLDRPDRQVISAVMFKILMKTLDHSTANLIRDANGIQKIVGVMERFPDEMDLQMYGCGSLGNLSSWGDNDMAIRNAGGITAIVYAMNRFPEEIDLQKSGCTALYNLSSFSKPSTMTKTGAKSSTASNNDSADHHQCTEEIKEEIRNVGGIPEMIQALLRHPSEVDLQKDGCKALLNLAQDNYTNQVIICEEGGIGAIVRALDRYKNQVAVQKIGCRFLSVLLSSSSLENVFADSSTEETVDLDRVPLVVVAAMKRYSGEVDLVRHACSSLTSWAEKQIVLTQTSDTFEWMNSIIETGAMKEMIKVMKRYPHDSLLQAVSFSFYRNMLLLEDDYGKENELTLRNGGGIARILEGMSKFSNADQLIRDGCNILLCHSVTEAGNEEIRESGGIELIVKTVMKTFVQDVEIQKDACSLLLNLSLDYNCEIMLRDVGAIPQLIDTMKEHPDDVDLQKDILRVLYNLSSNEDSDMTFEMAQNGIQEIIDAMKRFPKEMDIQKDGCGVLEPISLQSNNHTEIIFFGGISAITNAMKEFPEDLDLQKDACSALRNLSYSKDDNESIPQELSQVPHGIIVAMKVHSTDLNLQKDALIVLRNLLVANGSSSRPMGARSERSSATSSNNNSNSNLDQLQPKEGISEVIEAMNGFPEDIELQVNACGVLGNLSLRGENAKAIGALGGIPQIISALKRLQDDEDLQRDACGALRNLSFQDDNKDKIQNCGGISELLHAMKRRPGDVKLALHGCGALLNVSFTEGSKVAIRKAGGIPQIIELMSRHYQEVRLQINICGLLGNLSRNGENAIVIRNAGGLPEILKTMKRHPDEVEVQKNGCGALLNLSVKSDNKSSIKNLGGIPLIVAAMKRHANELSLQKFACGLLRNLSVKDDQGKIVLSGGVEAIIEGMKRFPDDMNVQMSGCGALLNLSNYEDNNAIIRTAGGVSVIISALHKHPTVEMIQQDGCRALRRLSTEEDTNNHENLMMNGSGPLQPPSPMAIGSNMSGISHASSDQNLFGFLKSWGGGSSSNGISPSPVPFVDTSPKL